MLAPKQTECIYQQHSYAADTFTVPGLRGMKVGSFRFCVTLNQLTKPALQYIIILQRVTKWSEIA